MARKIVAHAIVEEIGTGSTGRILVEVFKNTNLKIERRTSSPELYGRFNVTTLRQGEVSVTIRAQGASLNAQYDDHLDIAFRTSKVHQ